MNKSQLQKKELQDQLYKLEYDYSKLSNEYNKLQKKINSNSMTSFLCGTAFGIPSIFYGLTENSSLLLILGGGIMSLCIVFGVGAYKNNKKVEDEQNKININMHNIGKNIENIKNRIKNLKTIKIFLINYNEQKEQNYDTVKTRAFENCFYTLLEMFNKEEKYIIMNYKEYINNYLEEFDSLQKLFQDLDYDHIQYNEIDEYERIEIEESIVKDIIYEYIAGVKELFQIFLDEGYGYEDFIKNGDLTLNGLIGKNIFEKLSLLETEYTT